MADHPELFDEIDHKVRVKVGLVEDTEIEEVEEVSSTTDELILDLDNAIEIED